MTERPNLASMRAVCYWLIVAALGAALLFLMAVPALCIALALDLAFDPYIFGSPLWLIPALLFAVPFAAVALIFRGTYRSLRG